VPRTLITQTNVEDIDFVSERELNDFFNTVVITGTDTDTDVVQTFADFFPGQGLIIAGSGVVVATGVNFVEISSTASGSGITYEEHEAIDSLVHNLNRTGVTELTRNAQGQVIEVDFRTAPVTGTLIRSASITRDTSNRVTVYVENQHDETGTIIQTLTNTVNRTGGKVTSVTTVRT